MVRSRQARVTPRSMFDLLSLLRRLGLRGDYLRTLSMGAVGLCLGLWIRAKTVDQDERGNAERRAIFVGLWPPTLYLIGDSLDRSAPRGLARWRG